MNLGDWKSYFDDLFNDPEYLPLRLLAFFAPVVNISLIVFLAVSFCINLAYYLGDLSRDTLTNRQPLRLANAPDFPGLFVSAPAILHNQSETYELVLANAPLSMTVDTLTMRPVQVERATLLPAETTVFTFTKDSYQAVSFRLRNDPDRLSDYIWTWHPSEDRSAIISFQAVTPSAQTLLLTVQLHREPPWWGVFRKIFLVDNFDTAAIGIGVVLIVLQRITATRRRIQANHADEKLKTLLEQYRSGQLRQEFSALQAELERHQKRYKGVLSPGQNEALRQLASREAKTHRESIQRALKHHPTNASPDGSTQSRSSSEASLFLDEHVAWFLYYADKQDLNAKRDVFKELEPHHNLIRDTHIRRNLIRQARLEGTYWPQKTQQSNESDPRFPQVPDELIPSLAADPPRTRVLSIVGIPGSGKTTLLRYLRSDLAAKLEKESGHTIFLEIDASATQDEADIFHLFAIKLLRQFREQLNLHHDTIADLLDESDQDRLLSYVRQLNINAGQPSPIDRGIIALLARIYEQQNFQRVFLLIDNVPPSLDVDQLYFELWLALPNQLATNLRMYCACHDRHLMNADPNRVIALVWGLPDTPLEAIIAEPFFMYKPTFQGEPQTLFRLSTLLTDLIDEKNGQYAKDAIIGSSQTPGDLVVWRDLCEEYFTGPLANPKAEDWERVFKAMTLVRQERGGSVGWKKSDWTRARELLRQQAA